MCRTSAESKETQHIAKTRPVIEKRVHLLQKTVYNLIKF